MKKSTEIPATKSVQEKSWVKWEVLLLLWMAYLLNQGDRQVFNTVLPSIREALNLTDTSVGLIATVFNLFYACMVPLGGLAGDRLSRKWVVTGSILFWSIATMFTGLANSVFLLDVAGDHEDQSRETNRQNSGRRCCEHGLETIQDARLAPILLRLLSRGQRLVFQPESHKDTPEYSRHTKNNE